MTLSKLFSCKLIRWMAFVCLATFTLIGCSGSSRSDTNDALQSNESSLENSNNDNDSSNEAPGNNVTDAITLQPVQASLEIVANNTFRITWQLTPNATAYRVLENPDGVSGFTNISGELNATTSSFDHRVALFARVNAQYIVQSCNDQSCVNSNSVLVNASLDNAITYLKSGNPENTASQSDEFGVSVSLSADGNTLAVGAPSDGTAVIDQDDSLAGGAGDVYVFVRNDSLWQQQAFLTGSNTEESDRFGYSVSLSADGNRLAVGAPGEQSAAIGVNGDQSDNSTTRSGAAYTFVRNGNDWQQQAYLKASNTDDFDLFGWNVSLDADGNTLAVGARNESSLVAISDDPNNDDFFGDGAVYVFTQTNAVWQQQAFIKAGTLEGGDAFGDIVAISADGSTLAVGNWGDDSAATGINGDQINSSAEQSGAVHVFARTGDAWQQQAYLKASNTDTRDQFGIAIGLSADGNTLAVGALNEDSNATGIDGDQSDNTASESGAAYVFTRQGALWQQQAYLKSSNAGVSDIFGGSMALSADGNTLAVGAVGEDSTSTGINGEQFDGSSSNAGAVYVFVQSSGVWQQTAYVKASNTGAGDLFGDALALNENGSTLAVGARHEDSAAMGINGDQSDDSVKDAGAVYLY